MPEILIVSFFNLHIYVLSSQKQALKNESIVGLVLVISEFQVVTTGMYTGGNCGLRH